MRVLVQADGKVGVGQLVVDLHLVQTAAQLHHVRRAAVLDEHARIPGAHERAALGLLQAHALEVDDELLVRIGGLIVADKTAAAEIRARPVVGVVVVVVGVVGVVLVVVVVSVDAHGAHEHGGRDGLGLAADVEQALVHDVSAVELLEPVAVVAREALGLELLRLPQVPGRTAAAHRHDGQLEVHVVDERYLHALERHEDLHAGRLLVALDVRQRLVLGEENDSLAVVHIGHARHIDDAHDELRLTLACHRRRRDVLREAVLDKREQTGGGVRRRCRLVVIFLVKSNIHVDKGGVRIVLLLLLL